MSFLILVLTCKEIGPKYGNIMHKGFSTVAKVGFIKFNLSKNLVKHLSMNDVG